MATTPPAPHPGPNLYLRHMDSWALDLRSRNRSEASITRYRDTIRLFSAWLAEGGHPLKASKAKGSMVRDFLRERMTATSPGTAAIDYRNLRAFFNWLVREGEIKPGKNPMLNVGEIKVPDKPMGMLDGDQLAALLKTCTANTFEARRDRALILVLLDNGVRASGLMGLRYTPEVEDTNDVDLGRGELTVTLKGGNRLVVPIGSATAYAIDRYLRVRRDHRVSTSPWLWLGVKGRLTDSGLRQMLRRRGAAAGIGHVHPHMFRHTAAHELKAAGLSDEEIMSIFGWSSAEMARRYGRALAGQRARAAHRRVSPADALIG